MNLRFLKSVVAVSQCGSLNAAAQQLGLSHSAVSLQIKALEDELQFSILDRSRRPPGLTGEGMALVEHARRMEDLANDIRALADSSNLHGRVRLGVVPSTTSNLAAPALASMHARYPDLKIELITALSQRLVDLVEDGSIDCALVTDPGEEDPNLTFDPICAEPFRLIRSTREPCHDPAHLLRTRPFIWFDRRSRLSQRIELYLAERQFNVQTAIEVDTFEAAEALVRHNLGVSVLPRRALSVEPPGIETHPLPGAELERRVVLASRRTTSRRLLISKFAEALESALESRTPAPVG